MHIKDITVVFMIKNPKSLLDFVKDAKELFVIGNNFKAATKPDEITLNRDFEIYRSLIDADGLTIMFPVDIDYHSLELEDGLKKAIELAKKINQVQEFAWKFSGRSIHGLAYFDVVEGEDAISKFLSLGDYFSRRYSQRAYIDKKEIINGIDPHIYSMRPSIRALGSINHKTELYNVWIDLDEPIESILDRAKRYDVGQKNIPEITLKVPIIHKVKPKFYKRNYKYKPRKYYEAWFVMNVPPCIKKIIDEGNPNFERRKVLLNYLVSTGAPVDFTHDLFKRICDIEKYKHILQGNEINRFYIHQYQSISCAKIYGMGLCPRLIKKNISQQLYKEVL